MAKSTFQTAILKPLTSIFDNRSNIDETPAGAFRHKENFSINPDGKLSRAMGWVRPYNNPCVTNHDFHNQGVGVTLENRQPVTMQFQSTANDGQRRLFIATKTRLLQMDEANGEYIEIGAGLGADGEDSLTQLRFNAAELQNFVVFTNGYDVPRFHELGTTTTAPIADLATTAEDGGAITRARRTVTWQGVVFLLNTRESGTDYPSRIRWCDLNDVSKWDPDTTGSLADYQDLDYGEVILNAMPQAGSLYVFTDRSIWKCSFTADTNDPADPQATLNCIRVYTEPRNRAKCLSYENSLVSTGFSFYYMAADGIYEYNGYLAEPDRVEWLHRSTAVIYKNLATRIENLETRIDKQACFSPVAEYVPGPNEDETAGSGEIHFSWPVYDPLAVEVVDAVACEDYVPLPQPVGSGINRHTLVANVKFKTADYRNYGSTSMVNFTSTLIASSGCNRQSVLFAANGSDFCIKQMDTGSGRVMYDPASDAYTTAGYYSIVRGVFPLERFDTEKIIQSLLVGVIAGNAAETAVMRCRIGTSYEALDPNNTGSSCGVLWHLLSAKQIKCRNTRPLADYVRDNVRPDYPVEWMFLYRGRFLYYELKIENPDGTAPISGACSISRLEVSVKQA